jgi:predicted  nucleic acid-binding Zn-ribbon protein
VNRALKALKDGEKWEVLKSSYTQGTLYRALNEYFDWAQGRVGDLQGSIDSLEAKEEERYETLKHLTAEIRDGEKSVTRLDKDKSKLDFEMKKIGDEVNELQKTRDSLKRELSRLAELGVTDEAIARIGGMDFGDKDELIARLNTHEAYEQLKGEVDARKGELKQIEFDLHKKNAKAVALNVNIKSLTNELDELQRKTWMFKETQEVMHSFFQSGFDKSTLISLKKALDNLAIKGQPKTSIKRLIDGLSNYQRLTELESAIRIKLNELSELRKEIEKEKGTLSHYQETMLKTIETVHLDTFSGIREAYIKFADLMRELLRTFEKDLEDFRTLQKDELADFSFNAKETFASLGVSYTSELLGMRSGFEKLASEMRDTLFLIRKNLDIKPLSRKRTK